MRPEYDAGAGRSGQRVVHIAGGLDPAVFQTRIQAADIDAKQFFQTAATKTDPGVGTIQQFHPQRLEHADAAIVGGAAAYADDQMADSGIQRGFDQLSRAIAGGLQRVAQMRSDKNQSAGRRHLDHRRTPVPGHAVTGPDRLSQRPCHHRLDQGSASSCDHGRNGTLTSVCHGNLYVVGVRKDLTETGLDFSGHFEGRQALLE